jgi:hypothetical protein
MDMLMMIVDSSVREELEVFLTKEGVRGYSEIPEIHGLGKTGPRMGSAAYPGTSSMIFAMVDSSLVARLSERMKEYCSECHEQIHLVHWPVNVLN